VAKQIGLIGLGLIVGLALVWGGMNFLMPYTYHGSVIDPAITAKDFTLTDQHGAPFQLEAARGKLVVIFFGYTYCPDVCPVTLSQFRAVKAGLGAQADQVEFVFVTVDPERDTPERLAAHLAIFDPGFIGLTGPRPDLEAVYQQFGVYQAKVETNSQGGYLMDHTARSYVIDRQGNWRMTFPYGLESESMLADLQHLLTTSSEGT
jgi:protein SCO1/2